LKPPWLTTASDVNSLLNEVAAVLDLSPSNPAASAWDSLINDKTSDFVGREYIFDAITDFIATHDRGYFRLEGDPGDGKTAIVAEYVRRFGCVAHFNVRSQGLNTSRYFIDSLARQFGAKYGTIIPVNAADSAQYGQLVARMLTEARETVPSDVPLVIVVDALDEVDRAGDPSSSNVLFLPPRLPLGVYLIVSSRRAVYPLRMEVPGRTYDLADYRVATLTDIRKYLNMMGSRGRLRQWLAERNIEQQEFVEILARKSEGNFMYVRYVLPELSSGLYTNLDIQQLPHGLESYYEDHWQLMRMTSPQTSRTKVWVLYLLCEFGRPVSVALLARVFSEIKTGVDAIEVQEVLLEWEQFLRREEALVGTLFSIYHSSFRDFLHRQDIVSSAELTLTGVNGVIADVLWEYEYGSEE